MKSIAFWNRKGGATKTTTTVTLAHALTLLGKSVMIVDLDAQSNTSYWYGIRGGKTISDLILKKSRLRDCMIEVRDDLWVVQGDRNDEYLESKKLRRLCEDAFTHILRSVPYLDYVFFDCPPNYNDLHYGVLKNVNEIIIPASLEWFSLVGAIQVRKKIKRLGIKTPITKIIPTMHDSRVNKTIFVLEALKDEFVGTKIMRPVKICSKIAEAPAKRIPIYEYDPKCSAALDYMEIAKEMLEEDGKGQEQKEI